MKKVNYIAAGISALTLAGMLLPVGQVFAADQTKTSVAEINLKGGELTLDAVPDLNFGEIAIADLAAGQVSPALVDNAVGNGPVKNGTDAMDGNNAGNLSVTDLRGSNAGWTLTAQLGQMKNTAGKLLAGKLKLASTNVQTDNTSVNAINPGGTLPEIPIAGSAVTIWKAEAATATDNGQGQGKNTAAITENSGTTLILDKNPTATAGQYQAAITWTLSDAPK